MTSSGQASTNDIVKKESASHPERIHQQPDAITPKTQTDHVKDKKKSLDTDADYLPGANTVPLNHPPSALENIPELEEAAILFANEQVEVTELILQNLIQNNNADPSNSSAWLMLLDLYQITNNQIKFEQVSTEYANKFEVSAPRWTASPTPPTSTEPRLQLPAFIDSDTQPLIDTITDFAAQHKSVQLDCSQLNRIDFTACGRLLSGLMPLSKNLTVSIEFHDVNYLVMALLNAMGFNSIATISPRQR